MNSSGRRFLPDLAQPAPEILDAVREGETLDPADAAQLLRDAAPRLGRLFRTSEPVIVAPGPAAVLREIGLRAVVEHRVLVLVGGPDGAELAETAETLGREVIRAMVHPGSVVEPDQLRRFLMSPEVDAVALVHAETGTGALAPLADLARVVRARPGPLLFVDASRSLGAEPLETLTWGLDFVLAPAEGPLALPPGLAFATASPRVLARARSQPGRGTQLDLGRHHAAAAAGSSLTPVPPGLALALTRQLDRIEAEGLAARWARHRALATAVEDWCGVRGNLRLVAQPGRRAAAVSCIELPEGRSAGAVAATLAGDGWRVATGHGAHPERTLRIGHMGEVEPAPLADLLQALGRVLEETGG